MPSLRGSFRRCRLYIPSANSIAAARSAKTFASVPPCVSSVTTTNTSMLVHLYLLAAKELPYDPGVSYQVTELVRLVLQGFADA
jgi:hypothetical protein